MTDTKRTLVKGPKGVLAREYGGVSLPLEIMQSAGGYYLGTSQDGMPYTRESVEYWRTEDQARKALEGGEDAWTQRDHP